MAIQLEVKPKDKTPVGWDVFLMSWIKGGTALSVHKLAWEEESNGVWVGTTGNLAAGEYLVRAELKGAGREVEISVRGEPEIIQPFGKTWPMTVKVNGAIETMRSATWYFENTK